MQCNLVLYTVIAKFKITNLHGSIILNYEQFRNLKVKQTHSCKFAPTIAHT